jgi:glucose/arabinose dehydrogenase
MKSLILFLSAAAVFAASTAFGQIMLENAYPQLTFNYPVYYTYANDGSNRVYVVEQTGKIKVMQNDSTVSVSSTFLDVSARIVSGGEQGLLGLAFHPNYSTNRFFYIYYTKAGTGDIVIARFTRNISNPLIADSNSQLIVLTFPHPTYTNHNGGCLMFGQDGYLYAGVGDGGSGGDPNNNGQNTNVFLGKILRIDINNPSGGNNYGIPPTNPFAGGGGKPEIYTYGMRNPWRFSQDPVTGIIYIGDVGQDTWEEVDIMQNGGNYGWRIMEGDHCYNPPVNCDSTGLIMPIKNYPHSGNGCSITGGYVYRGTRVPSLVGSYIYGDYCSCNIWRLKYVGGVVTIDEMVIPAALPSTSLSSFGVDQNNELYVCKVSLPGAIYRFKTDPIGIQNNGTVVDGFSLQQNYPNPFNPSTEIKFTLGKQDFVNISIYDPNGKLVETLVNSVKQAGAYSVTWNASGISSGVYFYRLSAGDFTETKKMLMIK